MSAQPTIHALVEQTLAQQGLRHYSASAAPVIEALVTREQELVEGIVQAGLDNGMDESEVRDALAELGAHIKEEVATEQAAGTADTEVLKNVSAILEQVTAQMQAVAEIMSALEDGQD